MWIARDKAEILRLFDGYPIRDTELGCWYDPGTCDNGDLFIRTHFGIDYVEFKDVTWESGPVEVYPILKRV